MNDMSAFRRTAARAAPVLSTVDESRMVKAIMNTVLDGVITIDALGLVQSFNPAATRLFGYAPDEVIGQNVKMLMPEPYHGEHDGYLSHYVSTGEKKVIGIGREVSGRRKDGSVFPMELGINEMKVGGQRMFVGTVRDVTDRKRAEYQIQEYLAALQKSNEALDEFAYIASHDLKEPLRGLSNNAVFLKEDYGAHLDADGMRRLDRISFLAQRMEGLVNDLLYFSRLGRQELAVQKTDLNEVIAEISEMVESPAHLADVHIMVPEPLPTIICDRPRVTELFRNLIGNGLKYNDKAEKAVEIGCTREGARRIFYVQDNGIGIEPRFYETIFRIFKRLNTEDDQVKGTGVGLTFVRKIVERHGGTIWLESEIGVGTTFFFTLDKPE